jgi:hypothetical protein
MTTTKGYILYKNDEVVGFTHSEEKRDQWIEGIIDSYDKEKYTPIMKNNELIVYKKHNLFAGYYFQVERDSYRYKLTTVV